MEVAVLILVLPAGAVLLDHKRILPVVMVERIQVEEVEEDHITTLRMLEVMVVLA